MISVDFQGKPFNITLTQVYTTNTDDKEAEVDWFYEDLKKLQLKKEKCPFHYRELDCKSRKSRDTLNNGQVWTSSSDSKASVYNAGKLGSIPGSGRSPGEGNGNLLQYYCLENPMDGGAW